MLTQLRRAAPERRAGGGPVSGWSAGWPAVQAAAQQGQVSGAEPLVGEFADLLPESFVAAQRAGIARVVGEAQARQTQIAQLRATVSKEAGAPVAEDAWVAQLQRDRQNLESLVGKGDASVRQAQDMIAQAFLAQARKLRQASV